MPQGACEDCGSTDADHYLGRVLLCDRCFDKRVGKLTGFPELPEPPPPLTLIDTEGRRHRAQFRIRRAPTGIEVELEETGLPLSEGYRWAVLGSHDADVDDLVASLRSRAAADLSQRFLEPNPHRAGYLVATEEDVVEGRLVWNKTGNEIGAPYDVSSVERNGKTLA